MNIEQFKFIIQQNRNCLSHLYDLKADLKDFKKSSDVTEDTKGEFYAHNRLKKVSKQIAKLVSVQQALKQEVRNLLAAERSRVAEIRRAGN